MPTACSGLDERRLNKPGRTNFRKCTSSCSLPRSFHRAGRAVFNNPVILYVSPRLGKLSRNRVVLFCSEQLSVQKVYLFVSPLPRTIKLLILAEKPCFSRLGRAASANFTRRTHRLEVMRELLHLTVGVRVPVFGPRRAAPRSYAQHLREDFYYSSAAQPETTCPPLSAASLPRERHSAP